MCGICGEIRYDGNPTDNNLVMRMRERLVHRGSDGEGFWHQDFDGGAVAFGHTRLAIIDLSPAGIQPMLDRTERYAIVYNGEIYNYKEIRETLKKEDFIFRTETDTEVVLSAYIRYGSDCLNLFNGMFVFAIWDRKKRRLFCARDRLGIKPFYYRFMNGLFQFGSEVKTLLLTNDNRRPDLISLYDYLSLGLMHHKERTFLDGIRQIPAGCYLTLEYSGVSIQKYWRVPQDERASRCDLDIDSLKYLLNDSVKLRLRSDVPVGILLSGGLDSSSITALAALNRKGPLQAFSIEFDDSAFDESDHARLVASNSGASLSILKPEGAGLWEELDMMINAQDAPTHAPEVYSNWCMMRAVAKSKVKVLLSGQGGDELFAGYNWYPKYFLISLLRRLKMFTLFNELINLPENSPSNNTKNRLLMLASAIHGILPVEIKIKLKPEFECLRSTLQTGFKNKMKDRDIENLKLLDPPGLEEKMQNDLLLCNVPQYLHYEDANSMAFGIEERVPLLDHRLVEWAHKLASWWKIRRGVNKYPLRTAMNELLPEKIIKRRDKMGLSAPREKWLRNVLKGPIIDLFNGDCRIYETMVDRKAFLSHLNTYMASKSTPLSRLIWRYINLEKWLKAYC